MYQFPTANEVMGDYEPEPLDKRSRYKMIIIGNLLLALFIAAGVWFLFFFDSGAHNASDVDLFVSMDIKDKQTSTGDFTPIIIDDSTSALVTIQANIEVIPSITETAQNTPLESDSSTPNTTRKINLKEKNNETNNKPIAINTAKNQEGTLSKPLSAIDAITNELMKNKQLKEDSPKTQFAIIESNNSHRESASVTNPSLEVDTSKKKSVKQQKKNQLAENQVIVEQTTEKSLAKLINKNKQNLTNSEQILIKKLTDIDSAQTSEQKTTVNTLIYNSVSLKESSDIDKIMAAMGGVKKSSEVNAIEKIETKVKKLLQDKESEAQTTDAYVKKLQPETEQNKKEIRTITVKKNEKLWDIAVRAYGDGNEYKKILEANPLLKENPKLLKSGITLRVPL